MYIHLQHLLFSCLFSIIVFLIFTIFFLLLYKQKIKQNLFTFILKELLIYTIFLLIIIF